METGKQSLDKRFEDAAFAYGAGHYEAALAGFSELAKIRHPKATTYLGQMYLRGEGVAASVEKGLEFLELAASLGHSTAAFDLGALHRTGNYGVPKDTEKSKRFFILAKELGCQIPIQDYL